MFINSWMAKEAVVPIYWILLSHKKERIWVSSNEMDEKWKLLSSVRLIASPWIYSPWNSPGQNTGVGSLSLLQGIFPTWGSYPCLPHCRWILYQLSHKGSPRILEWVVYPFSSGSSWPRNQTGVSCVAGRFFTNWALSEAWKWKSLFAIQARILEWVAFPSPGASSQPRGRTQVSHVAGGFLTSWATREALKDLSIH